MKRLTQTLIIMLALLATPLLAQRYTVSSNKDLSAPFDSYKTFGWTKHVTTTNSLAYAINDLALKTRIKDAVAHELKARTMNMDQRNPDILVNFRVFDKAVTIKDADGYFHDAEYWGTDEVTNNRMGMVPFTTVYNDNDAEYYLEKGTLMVQILDAKKGIVVWQGYASGLTDGNVFDSNPDHIAKAARLIFERFDYVLNE